MDLDPPTKNEPKKGKCVEQGNPGVFGIRIHVSGEGNKIHRRTMGATGSFIERVVRMGVKIRRQHRRALGARRL
jgi:hypothetical protein